MENVILDPTQIPEIFENAHNYPDQPVDWDRAYEGYTAAVDWPTATFYERLYELSPNAKIILTVRDPEDWFKSICKTINVWLNMDITWPERMVRVRKMASIVNCDGQLHQGDLLNRKEALIQKFLKHIENTKSKVKPENLLIMELGDGWEKLCKFLNKPVPQIPYPHSNKGDNFVQLLTSLRDRLEYE